MDKDFTVLVLNDGNMFSLNSANDDIIDEKLKLELPMREKSRDNVIKIIKMTTEEHGSFSWTLDEKLEPIYKDIHLTGIEENTEGTMDKIIRIADEISQKKESYFSELDIAFQKALEEEDSQLQNKKKKSVIEKKHFLRNLPKTIDDWLEKYSENKFSNFDGETPFGNIFDIEITNKGSGYRSSPHVTIASPEKKGGVTAQAQASVLNGEIDIISMTNYGQGYIEIPVLTISPPEDTDGVTAEAKVTSITNEIDTDII